MSQVIDYSWARPGGAAIRAAGYVGVMRYLSGQAGKDLTAAERDDLQAHGLAIGLVWETGANRVLSGEPGGADDARNANAMASRLGYPTSSPLYFAIDFDASEGQQGTINDYFRGVASVIGLDRTGGYGGYYPIARLWNAGLIHYAWQTLAWSGGQVFGPCALYQNGETAFGGGADVNDVRGVWGGWGTAVPPVPPRPVTIIMEDGMELFTIDVPGKTEQQHIAGTSSKGVLRHWYDAEGAGGVEWAGNDPGVEGLAPYAACSWKVLNNQLHLTVPSADGGSVHCYQQLGDSKWVIERIP